MSEISTTDRSRPARRLARLLAVNLAIFLAGLVLLEMIFGGWLRPSRIYLVGLEREVVRRVPLDGLYPWPQSDIRYSRDHWGFRGGAPAPSAVDLVTVGGSTTEQRYLDDAVTWVEVCQREMARLGRPWRLANAGIDGQSSFGHLRNFTQWFRHVPGLRPRYILYYIGLNDFMKRAPDKFDEIASEPGGARSFAMENSALVRLWRTVRGHWQAEAAGHLNHQRLVIAPGEWVEYRWGADYDALTRAHLEDYERRLRTLVAATRAFGAEPVLVTQPCWWYRWDRGRLEGYAGVFQYEGATCNGLDFHEIMGRFNRRTLAVAAALGCPAIDLATNLTFTDGDFYDIGHNTPAGAEKIGRFLAAALAALPETPGN